MTIDHLLKFAVEQGAADLHLQSGTAPRLRVGGTLRELEAPPLTDEQVRQYVRAIAPRTVAEDVDAAMAAGPTSRTPPRAWPGSG